MGPALYKRVAELRAGFDSSQAMLTAVAGAMRAARTEPASVTPVFADLKPLLLEDDFLGRIHQAISAPLLESAYRATARDRRKFTAAEIPAVTQLFTPKFVVEFLLQNTLGKLWIEAHPDSVLSERWKWMTRRKDMGGTPMPLARELRICDPACGTMNFGLVAIDMLRDMYRDEIQNAGRPGWPTAADCCPEHEIDSLIIRQNLVGFDIDPQAIDLARQTLELKIGRSIGDAEHQLSVRDTLFDRIPDSFDVIATNPPYLSSRNLDPKIVRRLKAKYPSAWRDHYTCFLMQSLEMLCPGGRLGILSMHSFMFTGAFQRMRREIGQQADVQTTAHFGPGLFQIGNPGTLQTAAIVLQKKPATADAAIFYRLVNADDKQSALQEAVESSSGFRLSQSDLTALPRCAWMYWISPPVRRAFAELPKLGEIAPPRQGLATTDNARFVRYWWEVESPGCSQPREKWKPYAKGGRFRRWYESARHRVNWENDGREIKQAIVDRYPYLDGQWRWVAKNSAWYGREGITYSYLTSGSFSARQLAAGTIFDVAGSSLFPNDSLAILGFLNSSAAAELLSAINPTVNFQVGDLRQLPIPANLPDELREAVSRAVDCTRKLDCFDETSADFVAPEPWDQSISRGLQSEIAAAEQSVNQITGELYEIRIKQRKLAPLRTDRDDLARRWISYAVGIWLGRWERSPRGELAMLAPLDPALEHDLREILSQRAGEQAAHEIIGRVGGLEKFLSGEFLSWHPLLYRGRPVFWGFCGNGKTVAFAAPVADAAVMRRAIKAISGEIPKKWKPSIDDGFLINLAPLWPWIAARKLRESLRETWMDMEQGRYAFSHTARQCAKISRGSTVGYGPGLRPGRRRILQASAGR